MSEQSEDFFKLLPLTSLDIEIERLSLGPGKGFILYQDSQHNNLFLIYCHFDILGNVTSYIHRAYTPEQILTIYGFEKWSRRLREMARQRNSYYGLEKPKLEKGP